jgi:hypothetical protein
MLYGFALTVCLVVAARSLAALRRYRFCFATACFACVFTPLGTALGVLTILVLVRPSVKELFAQGSSAELSPQRP